MKPITPWHFSLLTVCGLVLFFLGPPLIQQCGHGPEFVSSRGGGTAQPTDNADADADGRPNRTHGACYLEARVSRWRNHATVRSVASAMGTRTR